MTECKVITRLSPLEFETIGAKRAIAFAEKWSSDTDRHCIVTTNACIVTTNASNSCFGSYSWIVLLAPVKETLFSRYFWPWEQIKSWDLYPDDATDAEIEAMYEEERGYDHF